MKDNVIFIRVGTIIFSIDQIGYAVTGIDGRVHIHLLPLGSNGKPRTVIVPKEYSGQILSLLASRTLLDVQAPDDGPTEDL